MLIATAFQLIIMLFAPPATGCMQLENQQYKWQTNSYGLYELLYQFDLISSCDKPYRVWVTMQYVDEDGYQVKEDFTITTVAAGATKHITGSTIFIEKVAARRVAWIQPSLKTVPVR